MLVLLREERWLRWGPGESGEGGDDHTGCSELRGEFCGVPFAITIVTRVVALFELVETS
jgi:hypothetical protein